MSCSRRSSARHPICGARRRAASISNMRRRSAFGSIRRSRRRPGSTLCWRASARPWSGRARTTMARARRRGRPIHGWLSLDKPEGMTSTEAVARVRRITQAAKVGHGGTLDPLATGVLPIALGEATKTVAYIVNGRKHYRFTARLGEARSTDDREGEVTAQSLARPGSDAIEQALPAFVGTISQVPPRFSAVKVAGERAYDLAREGEVVELAARPVEIHRLDLVATPGPG